MTIDLWMQDPTMRFLAGDMLASLRRWTDTSAYTTKRLPKELIAFMKTSTGARKVLFGSNYPMIMPAHALDGPDELGLSDDARSNYLHGNAARVFTTLEAAAA